MDGKRIQCWSNAWQHMSICLQPFTGYSDYIGRKLPLFPTPLHLTPPLGVIPLDDLRDFCWMSYRMARLQYGAKISPKGKPLSRVQCTDDRRICLCHAISMGNEGVRNHRRGDWQPQLHVRNQRWTGGLAYRAFGQFPEGPLALWGRWAGEVILIFLNEKFYFNSSWTSDCTL